MLANDTDVDGGSKTIAELTPAGQRRCRDRPANGTRAQPTSRTPTTATAPALSRSDDFTYTLNGGSTATVAVTVTCADDDPIAVDDAADGRRGLGRHRDRRARQRHRRRRRPEDDHRGHPAGQRHRRGHRRRHRAHLPAERRLLQRPAATTDDFTYTLNGGSTATVAVTVTCVDDDPPIAVDDAATVAEDSGASAIDVLANDTDADGGANDDRLGHPAGPRHRDGGRRQHARSPTSRTPATATTAAASDDFTYTLNGGSTATVAVTVTCVDDDPPSRSTTPRRSPRTPAPARSTCSPTTPTPTAARRRSTQVTEPANGTVAIAGGGTGAHLPAERRLLQRPGGRPTDDFTYTLNGGSTATVAVTVTCVDDDRRSRSTTPRRSPRTRAPPRSTCSPTTPTPTAARRRSPRSTQPANGTVDGHRRRHRRSPTSRTPDYCNDPAAATDDFTYTLNGGSTATVR